MKPKFFSFFLWSFLTVFLTAGTLFSQTAAPKVPTLPIPGSAKAESPATTVPSAAGTPSAAPVSAETSGGAAPGTPAVAAPAAPKTANTLQSASKHAPKTASGTSNSGTKASEETPATGKPALDKFHKAQDAYKKAILAVRDLQKQYVALSTTEEQKEEIGTKLQKYAEFITKLHPKLLDLAEAAWIEGPSKDPEMLRFIVEVLEVRLVTEDYEKAQEILDGLLQLNIPEILPDLYDVAGETAFMLNNFEKAGKFFALADSNKVLSERCANFNRDLPYFRVNWGKESILRERAAAKKNLPRVSIETTKGTIVVELYENEAPNTVANFIYLVEKGFYDGLYFDSVIPGFGAESGRSLDSTDGGPGYTIRDEYDEQNARCHYRGTLSMSNNGPNTAGSRFFFCFSPMKELDGKFVVFGRIVEGMEVLSKLQRMDAANPDPMAEPDQIVEAKVIRKDPDKKYRPKVIRAKTDEEDASANSEKSSKSSKSAKDSKSAKNPKGKSAY